MVNGQRHCSAPTAHFNIEHVGVDRCVDPYAFPPRMDGNEKKIGTISLSPRANWRMSSDSDMSIWLDEFTRSHPSSAGMHTRA